MEYRIKDDHIEMLIGESWSRVEQRDVLRAALHQLWLENFEVRHNSDLAVRGVQFGARFRRRGSKNDPHVMVELLSEDDGAWFTKALFSSFWVDDLLNVLEKTRKLLKKNFIEDGSFGWRYKE